jgi:dihydrodipicolinate synthase/N-acetylneuraminate lyase
VDVAGVARLLAWFEACGCRGAVLAGTNGEGPSLGATEKRDLLRDAMPMRGHLQLTLGIATPSLDEAVWLSRQAEKAGANALLVMPPFYFRSASETGIRDWFLRLLDVTRVPTIVYNYPRMTGFVFSPELVETLGAHPMTAGLKDSSGERGNLFAYRQAMPAEKALFVGDETLLIDALESGWSGAISGVSNVLARWVSGVTEAWIAGDRDLARARFALAVPVIEALRRGPQPALSKAILVRFGVIEHGAPRLPLEPPTAERLEEALALLAEVLGMTPVRPGI